MLCGQNAFYVQTISQRNMLSTLSTPETAGLYILTPGGSLSLQSAGGQVALALSNQGVNNTASSQIYSLEPSMEAFL